MSSHSTIVLRRYAWSRLSERTDALLAGNPAAGRAGRVAGTRELVLPGRPDIVAYRVGDRVEVLAIMHGARDWPESLDAS